MSLSSKNDLTRIGVIYDGNYYLHVSNYYNYVHPKRSRLSISGLHNFIRHQVAIEQNSDVRLCQIVDAHFFRGRLNAQEANQKGNQLYYDRVFDDILMSEGVVTHYLPLRNLFGNRQEKGIDVWLALETFELALNKKFDLIVLISSDGDYVPLIRKLNTLGTRVMVLSWEFEYTNEEGQKSVTRTSKDLLEQVTYPVAMHDIIEAHDTDPIVQNLFVQNIARQNFVQGEYEEPRLADAEIQQSVIHSLKTGYGFITYPPNNLYFRFTSILNSGDAELQVGDTVNFALAYNDKGELIATNVEKIEDGDYYPEE